MNRYKLVHVTRFSYDGPVSQSYNELRLRPRHDDQQSCLSFRVTTAPLAKAVGHQDFYGNWVHLFHILPEHRSLKVETEAVILTHPQPAPVSSITLRELDAQRDALREEYFDQVTPSRYCPLLWDAHREAIQELSREAEAACDGTVYGFGAAAAGLIHRTFEYRKGATHVHSSVADCLETRAGVCQDFSHLLISLLRARGIPARYVSGYLVPNEGPNEGPNVGNAERRDRSAMERVIGGLASHAWVQVYTPDAGWLGLDPTVGDFVEAQHIRVAYGRDYGDVPPVRGVYKGHAGQSLSVDVLVRPALDDAGVELLEETAAAPPPTGDEELQEQQQQQ